MMRNCLRLFMLQMLNYALIAASFRFLAAGSYVGTGLTDGAIAFCGFSLVQNVVKAETLAERLAYTVGGVCGSLLGLFMTRHVK